MAVQGGRPGRDFGEGGYCRVAFLDRERRFLDGDAAIAQRHADWTDAQFGHLDPGSGVLVLDLRDDASGHPGPPGTAFMLAHFAEEVLGARMAEIGASYGLSRGQTDFLETLVRAGGVRDAARLGQISYTSARNMLAEIKAKTGFSAIAPMVGHMLELASGTPQAMNDLSDRHDLFGLTDRQFAIACGLSTAQNRGELAARLGLSEAVVKAELKDIFLTLGVENAGQLVRKVVEARLSTTRLALDGSWPPSANLLPETRSEGADGRTVCWSDFGPATGRPVFILHSSITARAPPTRLVGALQQAGFRPLAIDRPGFGGTSPKPAGADSHRLAAEDFRHVCAVLGLARADIIARGSGQAAMMLAHCAPELVGHAVLVNPTPRIDFTTTDRGPLGALKRRFAKNPAVVEGMIRLLTAFTTPRRLRNGMLRSFRGSAPDEALIADPQFVADYLRATRDFAEGHLAGYVAEQVAWVRGYDVPPLPGRHDWRIVQGAHFVLHDPDEALRYWRRILPDTPVTRVAEAGQMLAYSHPQHVVDALRACAR